MRHDLEVKPVQELDAVADSFDTYTDDSVGEDKFTPRRLIQGERIDFTKEAVWVGADDKPLPSDLRLVVDSVERVVQEWGLDNKPVGDPIIVGPNEPWPDVEKMNGECPRTKWRERFGKMVGPYQAQKLVYMWHPVTMQKYTWPTSSSSGMACVSDFVEKIQMKRQFTKMKAVVTVKLGSRPWSKQYKTRGPDFVDIQWLVRNKNGALVLLPDELLMITGKAATGDEIPF